jgi:hypothetical protein
MGRISERRLVKDWLPSEQKLVRAPLSGERDECMNENLDWWTKTEGRFDWLSIQISKGTKWLDHKLYSKNSQTCNTTVHMPFSSTHGSLSYEWRQFTEISWQLIKDVTVLCLEHFWGFYQISDVHRHVITKLLDSIFSIRWSPKSPYPEISLNIQDFQCTKSVDFSRYYVHAKIY